MSGVEDFRHNLKWFVLFPSLPLVFQMKVNFLKLYKQFVRCHLELSPGMESMVNGWYWAARECSAKISKHGCCTTGTNLSGKTERLKPLYSSWKTEKNSILSKFLKSWKSWDRQCRLFDLVHNNREKCCQTLQKVRRTRWI